MRDHRHILIECYLGQLAPPRIRRDWRRMLRRFDRASGRGYRLTILPLLTLSAVLGMPYAWWLASHESRWAVPVGVAGAVIVPIVIVTVALIAWREMRRRMSLEARLMRRWRVREAREVSLLHNESAEALNWEEIENRRRFWRWRVGQPLDVGRVLYAGAKNPWLALFMCACLCLGGSVGFAGEIGIVEIDTLFIAPIGAVFVYAGVAFWVYEPVRLRHRLLRSWSDCHCPACRYDLHGLGKPPCPPRCPECGFPWPMLPPPSYAEEDLARENRVYLLWRNPADRPPTKTEAEGPRTN